MELRSGRVIIPKMLEYKKTRINPMYSEQFIKMSHIPDFFISQNIEAEIADILLLFPHPIDYKDIED